MVPRVWAPCTTFLGLQGPWQPDSFASDFQRVDCPASRPSGLHPPLARTQPRDLGDHLGPCFPQSPPPHAGSALGLEMPPWQLMGDR